MRILIVGAGYTGGRAARAWAAAGHSIAATSVNEAHLQSIADVASTHVARGSDLAAMRPLAHGADAIVVAISGPYGSQTPEGLATWRDCYEGTAATIATLVAENPSVGAVVSMSSTNTYGSAGGAAICDESQRCTSESPLVRSQLAADEAYLALNGPNVASAVMMVGHIYGPAGREIEPAVLGMPGRVVAYPGDSAVSLVHVDDVVGTAWHLLSNRLSGRFNVVDDTPGSRESFYNGLAARQGLAGATWAAPGGLPTAFPNAKLKATGYAFLRPTFPGAPGL